ncbi:MAG TPA: HAD family hydrolase [Rectinemataceae bacterium]|nr:HAD family hydrolase [Rectinemataceae bacterium]
MAYKAVAFDLDGTLYPPRALYSRAWPLALGNLRLTWAFAEVRKAIRAPEATEACRTSGSACGEELRRLQARMTAARLGAPVELVARRIDEIIYRDVVACFERIRPFPGAVDALDALRAARLRLAVLSDFPPERKLEYMGLSRCFDVALCSEDSGFLKPEREPFVMLCDSLALEPEDILYVGNSVRYDLAGARAAGLGAAILSRRKVPGADLSFSAWEDLVEFAL